MERGKIDLENRHRLRLETEDITRALCTAYCICSVISSILNPNRCLMYSLGLFCNRSRLENEDMTRIMYSLLHVQFHFFNLESQSMSTLFSWSFWQRAAEKRPTESTSIEIGE